MANTKLTGSYPALVFEGLIGVLQRGFRAGVKVCDGNVDGLGCNKYMCEYCCDEGRRAEEVMGSAWTRIS